MVPSIAGYSVCMNLVCGAAKGALPHSYGSNVDARLQGFSRLHGQVAVSQMPQQSGCLHVAARGVRLI